MARVLGGAAEPPLQEAPTIRSTREADIGRWLPVGRILGLDTAAAATGGPRLRVVALTSGTCPVSRRYVPTLASLMAAYSSRGVEFLFLDPTVVDREGAVEEGAAGILAPLGRVIPDPDGRLAARLGARSTTEVVVVDARDTVLYRGAVDDQYGLGYSRNAPRRRYLVEALEAALADRRVTIAATTAPGCVLDTPRDARFRPGAGDTPITFHNRISRILQTHCVECHRDGGVAPFPLVSPDDLRAHAGMVRRQVDRGAMPPWFAGPTDGEGVSPWSNDRRLPEEDREDLLSWLDGDRMEGDPADAPQPRRWTEGWTIGEPDAVVSLPEAVAIPASGQMPYQNLYVQTDFGGDRWVRAWELAPTAREVVHHVLVFVIPPESATPENLRRSARQAEAGGYFAVYVPGTSHQVYPDGMAKRIPAGATLHFQVHYTPSGTGTTDRTRLGLIFAEEPPEHAVEVAGVANVLIDIPPNTVRHPESARLRVPHDAEILALFPHMHVRGAAFRFDLVDPDGTRRTLLDVPRYDFNWQLTYRFAEPVRAVRGSRIEAFAWYDNSRGNPANPDPDRRVRWGPQTDDEMLIGYVEYFVPGADPSVRAEAGATRPGLGGQRWERLFDQFDIDGDGRLEPAEIPERLRPLLRAADADGDGVIVREELGAAAERLGRRNGRRRAAP